MFSKEALRSGLENLEPDVREALVKYLTKIRQGIHWSHRERDTFINSEKSLILNLIETKGITEFDELVYYHGTVESRIDHFLRTRSTKELKQTAKRRKHALKVGLYAVFLGVVVFAAFCIFNAFIQEDYSRGSYVDTMFTRNYVADTSSALSYIE